MYIYIYIYIAAEWNHGVRAVARAQPPHPHDAQVRCSTPASKAIEESSQG